MFTGLTRDTIIQEMNAAVVVRPQNFTPLNRGDMFFPSGYVASNTLLAAMATPLGSAGRNVHAIPVSYVRANSDTRPMGAIAVATPNYKG